MRDAFHAGDVDGQLAVLDPQIEFVPLRAQLEGESYHGHAGYRRWLADIEADWDFIEFSMDQFHELGDTVVTLGHLKSRGKASGVDIDVPIGMLWRLRDRKIVHARTYSSQESALRAAGIEPEAAG
jgi:ketosteroid isomerase-like protein